MSRIALRGFIIEYVRQIRKESPRIGCAKLFVMCRTYFGDLFCIGRDSFYTILRQSGLMLRIKRTRRCRTTNSGHGYPLYPNLIREFVPTAINQLWVCDITYIWTNKGFCFLSLVTDAYSHKIRGYSLAPTLAFRYTEQALDMAIGSIQGDLSRLIHHSDRGFQYAYSSYTDKLKKHHISISMTENPDPLENAIAERVNGILKQEWLNGYEFTDMEHVRAVLEPAIQFYNNKRPHASIDYLTPQQAEEKTGMLKKRWKKIKTPLMPDIQQQEKDSDAAYCLKMLTSAPSEELIQASVLSLTQPCKPSVGIR